MADEYARSCIERWTAGGLMEPGIVLERWNKRTEVFQGLGDEEHAALEHNFQEMVGKESQLTESAFVSFVQRRASIPIDCLEALRVLFRSVCYLSNCPFTSSLGCPTTITFQGLIRALVWLLPDRTDRVIEVSGCSRARTPADHRRLIFQSLATSLQGRNIPLDAEAALRLATENATIFATGSEHLKDYARTNFDMDGDEVYHDVLDVLYSSQPDLGPPYSDVHRDHFREMGKQMHGNAIPLHHLSIPRKRLENFFRLLLVLNFNGTPLSDSSSSDDAVRSLVGAFCRMPDFDGTTWPMFDFAVKNIMPRVFDPLYRLLCIALFDKPYSAIIEASPPPTDGDDSTLPMFAQLNTFLSESLWFGDLKRAHHWKTSKPTISELTTTIQSIKESAILVVSGQDSTGATHNFGAYITKPASDAKQIQKRQEAYAENTLLFQTTPVQDVFRGTVGKPAWAIEEKLLVFGSVESGASLMLDSSVEKATFLQKCRDTRNLGVYGATDWRGDFSIDYHVAEVELWEECST